MTSRLRRQLLGLIAGAAAVTASGGAYAHHSFAMFDAEKKVELEGVVKEFQWTNPHAWIMLNVAGEQGAAEPWAIEMNTERPGTAGLETEDADARHADQARDPSAQGRDPRRAVHAGHASGRHRDRQCQSRAG